MVSGMQEWTRCPVREKQDNLRRLKESFETGGEGTLGRGGRMAKFPDPGKGMHLEGGKRLFCLRYSK